MGIPIFIITARDLSSGDYTIKQLASFNLGGYKSIFLVGHDIIQDSKGIKEDKGDRKAVMRQKIEERGYKILMNIGDDPEDFKHDHFIYGIKLPYLY